MNFVAPVLGIQAVAILADEAFFHRHRALPLWERIGHPLDTFSMLVCLMIPVFFSPHRLSILAFGGLGLVSCLLVTKDEHVHAQHCHWKEHWLHALLFLVHPVALIAIGSVWMRAGAHAWFRPVLIAQTVLMSVFLSYQIIYWNFLWQKQR